MFEAVAPGHPEVTSLLWSYAALLDSTGRETEAAEMEERARELQTQRQP